MYTQLEEKLEQFSRSLLGAYPQQVKARVQAAICRKAVGLHRNTNQYSGFHRRDHFPTFQRPQQSQNHKSGVQSRSHAFIWNCTFLLFLRLDNLDKFDNPKSNLCCIHEV